MLTNAAKCDIMHDMRCIICDNKLDVIIPDEEYRGGYRPCSSCLGAMYNLSEEQILLYDDSDPQDDIDAIVGDIGDNYAD